MGSYKDKDWLREQLERGRGYTDIAKEFNVDLTTVRYFVKKFGLKLKKKVKHPIKILVCPVCGDIFEKRVTKRCQAVYCSPECAYKGRSMGLTVMPKRNKEKSNIPDKILKEILNMNISLEEKVRILNENELRYYKGSIHFNTKRIFPYWKSCEYCKELFMVFNNDQATRKKYCSKECVSKKTKEIRFNEFMNRSGGVYKKRTYKPNTTCDLCGTPIYRSPKTQRTNKGKFCSRACRNKAYPPKNHQPHVMYGENNPAWKGGITLKRAKGNYKGVIYVRCPEEYLAMARKDGYIMEHRLVMAQHLGRLLDRKEVVHHIDHNPSNNNIENLMLFENNKLHKLYEAENPIY